MVELVDAYTSQVYAGNGVRVQVPLRARPLPENLTRLCVGSNIRSPAKCTRVSHGWRQTPRGPPARGVLVYGTRWGRKTRLANCNSRVAARLSGVESEQAGVLIQRVTIGNRYAAHVERDATTDDAREPVGRQVVATLLGHDDQVGVSDAVAVDQETDALESKSRAHSATDALGDEHDALREVVGDVGEVIDVRLGDYETFAGGGWAQGHECGDGFIFVDDARWRPACYDLTEYAGRHVDGLKWPGRGCSRSG
jgi:hypothetical protein